MRTSNSRALIVALIFIAPLLMGASCDSGGGDCGTCQTCVEQVEGRRANGSICTCQCWYASLSGQERGALCKTTCNGCQPLTPCRP